MKAVKKSLLLGAIALLATTGLAMAAGLYTNGVPPAGGTQYPTTVPLTGNETFPADTNLTQGQNPASESISATQIAGMMRGLAGTNGYYNALIGGDFATNLWQRGTSVGSISTTYLYTADRWFAWSGTSTTMSVAQDTTAAEIPAGTTMAAKVARTGAGVVQTCVAQEVESSSAIGFAGQTAELAFNAYSGAGFSSTGSLLQVYVITGTGTDEGAQKLAWGLNAGGGGSTAWTGQASTLAGTVSIGQATMGRYVAVATIPAATTEVAVAICWKPVGASPSNDYVALSKVQLDKNPALAAYAGTVQSATVVPASAFEVRPQAIETALQQRYFWALTEPAASIAVAPSGQGASTTTCTFSIPLPQTMRAAPTYASAGSALSTSTWTVTHVVTNTALGTPYLAATTGGSTVNELNLTATVASGLTAGQTCTLTGAGGTNIIQASSEL